MKKIIGVVLITVLLVVLVTVVVAVNESNTGVKATDDHTEPLTSAVESITASTESAPGISTEPTTEPVTLPYTDSDIVMLAKLVWGEARGVKSETEQAAVIWCILNRVDALAWPNTIEGVVTQPHQFVGYNPDYPATEKLRAIAEDVLYRWYMESTGADTMRVLPREYTYFTGDGERNYFRKDYEGGGYWDWSLVSPYES